VRLIISMGKSLHMRIVAEGVETEEQLARCRRWAVTWFRDI
jgi:sensor c-di-GMP phosphodiesterase-like protein